MKNKSILILSLFLLVIFVFYIVNSKRKISQELKLKDRYIELQANEASLYKNIVSNFYTELAKVKDTKDTKDTKEIDYEKAITLGMLLCAGEGDKGELNHKASFRDKKGVEQVIKNRMLITGRTFYKEATAKYQFSAFNRKGLYIDKYNIPRQSKCIKDAVELMSKEDLTEFSNSTFYHAFNVNPKWARNFHETTRTDLHIFYAGDKGYKSSKTILKNIEKARKAKKNIKEDIEENAKVGVNENIVSKIDSITKKIKLSKTKQN